VTAGTSTRTPRDALAQYTDHGYGPCPWSRSVNWCVAEGYKETKDQCRPVGLMAPKELYVYVKARTERRN